MVAVTWELLCLPGATGESGRVGFPAKNFPKRTCILSIPTEPYSFHSVHSAIGSRMNGMIFRSFRKRYSSQKNTYRLFRVFLFRNSPKRTRPRSPFVGLPDVTCIRSALQQKKKIGIACAFR